MICSQSRIFILGMKPHHKPVRMRNQKRPDGDQLGKLYPKRPTRVYLSDEFGVIDRSSYRFEDFPSVDELLKSGWVVDP